MADAAPGFEAEGAEVVAGASEAVVTEVTVTVTEAEGEAAAEAEAGASAAVAADMLEAGAVPGTTPTLGSPVSITVLPGGAAATPVTPATGPTPSPVEAEVVAKAAAAAPSPRRSSYDAYSSPYSSTSPPPPPAEVQSMWSQLVRARQLNPLP